MRLLLDTDTFLWFVLGDSRCSQTARELIEDEANEKWLSPASHWELAIKISIGKYTLPIPFEEFIQRGETQVMMGRGGVGAAYRSKVSHLRRLGLT